MFGSCSNLISLDLSNFITSKVTDMSYLFYNCVKLTSLNLSKFDTSKVLHMNSMFYNCQSLQLLDISNFITSQVKSMNKMFSRCSSLYSLNLSNFETSNVIDMEYMFYNCSSLASLDLSNFKTPKLNDMSYMFYKCESLISLNLSNFDFSNIRWIYSLFSYCSSLKYIELSDFFISKNLNYYDNIFYGCSSLECISLKNTTPDSFFDKYIFNYKEIFYEKSDKLVICTENISLYTLFNECKIIINCNNFISSIKTYQYYSKCLNEKYNNSKYICKTCYENYNYYWIYDDLLNNKEYINCYIEPKGYYFDRNDLLYKLCYSTCETCDKEGNDTNHNCINCKNNFKIELIINNYINCLDKCPYYYYIDKISNKTYCTHNLSCRYNYNKLIINKSQCIENCELDSLYKFEFEGICFDENQYIITTIIIRKD